MKIKTVTLCLTLMSWATYAQHNHGSGHSNAPKHNKKEATSLTTRAAPAFQQQLRNVFIASLQLKEALILSNAAKASASVAEIKNSITKVDMSTLKDEALMDWIIDLRKLNENLDLINNSDDLATQRKAFAPFNEALYKSIKRFGSGGLSIYYDYCPMANNSEGAYWLSDEKEIKNPYYGEAMLTCGSVKEVIY